MAGYRIVEIELVSLHQHHDRGRRKLFPQRSGLKNALSLRGHTVLDVGDAVPFGAQRYSIFDDRYGRAGYVLCRHFLAYKSIDSLVDAVGRRSYLSQNAERCQCCVQHRNLLSRPGLSLFVPKLGAIQMRWKTSVPRNLRPANVALPSCDDGSRADEVARPIGRHIAIRCPVPRRSEDHPRASNASYQIIRTSWTGTGWAADEDSAEISSSINPQHLQQSAPLSLPHRGGQALR